MTIRPTREEDIDAVLEVFDEGRSMMRENGNFVQWTDGYPGRQDVLMDIARGQSYVMDEDGRIVATFVLQMGAEPTYGVIEGRWSCNEPYGTIHRIARRKACPGGVMSLCVRFCFDRVGYLRVDTHSDNKIMRGALEKLGFAICGTIFLRDGSPRIAYDLKKC